MTGVVKRNLLFCFGACLHTQQTRRRPNAGPMLAHRLRRWPSIKPALVQGLSFAGLRSTQETQNICITFVQCVEDVGPALYKIMLYKCFVFAWNSSWSGGDYKPTPTQCLLNVGPASPVLASRHSVLMSTSFVTICNRLRPFAIVCNGLQPFAIVCDNFVASELKDPICHSDECQIGSFSSEATICGRLRRFATICDRLRPFAIVCDHLRSFATVCDHVWSFVTVCDYLRSLASICDSLRRFAIACDRLR